MIVLDLDGEYLIITLRVRFGYLTYLQLEALVTNISNWYFSKLFGSGFYTFDIWFAECVEARVLKEK
jgi:hypothetical protein